MDKLFSRYRLALMSDLDSINQLIQAAVTNWPLPLRLKRRAVPVLQYDPLDFDHLTLFVCESDAEILGVAAIDLDHAPGKALLHGLFVLPTVQGNGIGKQLMQMSFNWAEKNQLEAVVIRAERVSVPYFQRQGLTTIESLEPNDYPHQFEKTLIPPAHQTGSP